MTTCNVNKIIMTLLTILLAVSVLLTACAGATEMQEGERYFEGDIDFEHAESCTISYILSPDGLSIRNVGVTIKNMSYSIVDGYTSVTESSEMEIMSFKGGEVDGQGFITLKSDRAVLRLNVTGDGASGEMDFYYKSDPVDERYINIFVGSYPFVTEDKTDSMEKEK